MQRPEKKLKYYYNKISLILLLSNYIKGKLDHHNNKDTNIYVLIIDLVCIYAFNKIIMTTQDYFKSKGIEIGEW